MRVLLAGATGYLGGYIARELNARLIPTLLIGRNEQKLLGIAGDEADIRCIELTQPETLQGCCEGIDVVISTIGITRQRDGLSYCEVDFQANLNLLREAERAGVSKFIYTSALQGASLRHLKIFEAKEAFVDALVASSVEGIVIRPNGFFSDMEDFLKLAVKGKVYLFGDGSLKLNPIHGADLANVFVDACFVVGGASEINVGGPEVLTQRDIAELALDAVYRAGNYQKVHGKVILLPDWIRRVTIPLLRWFTPLSVYGPAEFFLTAMASDYVAPAQGDHRLREHFAQVATKMVKNN